MKDQTKAGFSYRSLWKYHISGILVGAALVGLFGFLASGAGGIFVGVIVVGLIGEFIGVLIGRALT